MSIDSKFDLANAEAKDKVEKNYEQGKDKAENLYCHAKESATELYEGGMKKIEDVQDAFRCYSNDFVKIVKEKPITSVLIAGGLSILLSAFFKR